MDGSMASGGDSHGTTNLTTIIMASKAVLQFTDDAS